ncbi:hypothetical protein BW722_05640 [Lawsonia intracellularis]|nr:hypothetical protein BW722_05640 [Lawsonia intracellularis]
MLMPMLPVRFTGPTNQTPVDGREQRTKVLAQIDHQHQAEPPRSLGQRILTATGLARVGWGLGTLGLSELARALHGYNTRESAGAAPRALANQQIQRENRQLLQQLHDNVATGQFQFPHQEAVESAMEKAKTDLQGIASTDPRHLLGRSILSLQSKPSAFDEPITDKSLSHLLSKELKQEMILEEANKQLRHALGKRGPWGYGADRAGLLSERSKDIRGLTNYPPDQINRELEKIVSEMVTRGENLHNSSEARKSALSAYVQAVMDRFQLTNAQVTGNPEYKKLKLLLDESAGTHERQLTARNGGLMPLISQSSYEEALHRTTQQFLIELGVR